MKVSGPNSGPGAGAPDAAAGAGPDEAAGAIGGSAKADAAGGAQRPEDAGRAFAEKLAAAGTPPTPTAAPATPARPAELNATTAIASDLDTGRLTPAAAVDRILEQVLEQQVGADAPAAVREQVRAALQDALENDPMLAEQLRRLGAWKLDRMVSFYSGGGAASLGGLAARNARFDCSASRTRGGRKSASVSKSASASISIAARSATGVRRSMITVHWPLILHRPPAPAAAPVMVS